ncbi:MAG: PAS domain S-box protein [Verrucomicrobiota bacterium]
MSGPAYREKWTERCQACGVPLAEEDGAFGQFLERSADAIWLFDPAEGIFIDCNQAAVELMRCGERARVIGLRPEDLSAPVQHDGTPTSDRAVQITELVQTHGSLRFEWQARRFTGEEVPLEVLATALTVGGRPLHVIVSRDITERKSAEAALRQSERKFRLLFENSADGILILDPERQVFLDCNEAAVAQLGGSSKEWLLSRGIVALAPEFQPDSASSLHRATEMIARAVREGTQRFEWAARRQSGEDVPLELAVTPIQVADRRLLVVVSREVTYRKDAEVRTRQLNLELERRIVERTNELVRANQHLRTEIQERERTESLLKESEARARTLVEHAPDAIVVFDCDTGRFTEANENAVRLYGLSRDALLKLGPADVSPALQPDGRSSIEVAQERLAEALQGRTPVFEWWHRNAAGLVIPCEIRLVRLPAQGRRLVRGSVIDNTERYRKERIQRAIYQISEAIHTTDDLDSLYRQIHSTIQSLMLANNLYIALYDPASELFSFPYFVDEMDPPPAPMKLTTGLTSHVLRTGKALLVNRQSAIRKESSGRAILLEATQEMPYIEVGTPAAVWLGVPLQIRGRTFGVMAVQDYREDRAYGDEEKRILTFVAEQTAIAIDRKQAEQALRKRTEQVAQHRDVLLELAQMEKSDFRLAVERICQLSAESLNVARVGFWSLQDNDQAIVCELLYLRDPGRVDAAATGVRVLEPQCPAYFRELAGKRPIAADRAVYHPATSELAESYLKPLRISSMLDVPVWLHGEVIGVLCHEHIGPAREWDLEEIDFASSLATMVSLAHEAAQRARSEQALRESEEKFRALFEASSQGVMLHDEEKFLEVNPATVRILGYNGADEIVGKHPAEVAPAYQPNGELSEAFARRQIEECMRRGNVRFEWLARNARDGEVPLEVILTRIAMGGRQMIQAVINDITERKNAEAELLRALAREKELGQLKSNFVSMVSHEFRTPLGIIMSSAEILQDYLEQLEPDERQHHLQSISKNTRRMADLMEEVLLLGRFEAGKMNCQPAPFDLPSFSRRLVDEMLSATDRRCPIDLDVAAPSEASADERLLRHIFTNLITNAVKYSEPGQPVRLRIRVEGRDAICVVEDDGIGIPEADLQWLFNAFHRGRNVGQRPGTGLGLVIVKRCVELHGGRIRVESKVGEGTSVTVRLPVFGTPALST